MDAYQQWNDALAQRFFNPDQAGRNVRLYVNRDLIDEMEAAIPDAGTFRMAVAGSFLSPHRDGVCRRALQVFENWRDKGWRFPPYIGYLSLFVLASDIDGDYSPNAYYPRLWELLTDERRFGRLPSFDRMHLLWQDLETWAMDDCNGELGLFQARPVGGYVHVGYPISQSLLVEQERRVLPWIFYDAELDPGTQHSPGELARALRRPFAKQLLRAKTVRLAENPQDASGLYSAMLEAVAGELADWDGSSPGPVQSGNDLRPVLLGLRICIDLDRISGTAKASLRCKLNQRRRDFPEDGLVIEGGFEAGEAWNGWSSPVKSTTTGEALDASNLDWRNGEIMRTVHGWRLKLQAREVRVFISGIPEGISGFVETYIVPQGQQFYLSYPASTWPRLERWATTQCRGFQDIDIEHGLPEGWRFAEFQEVISDEAVRDEFPGLSLSRNAHLQLVGGIRSERGNLFFDFAPPGMVLSGGSTSTVVYCNEQPLPPPGNSGVFELPANLPKESRITLAAREGQSALDRLSLFLTGDFSLDRGEPEYFLDSSGASTQYGASELAITGALIKGLAAQIALTAAELFEDLVYEIGGMQGYLVGQQPGQIVTWPSESFPTGWTPVWVVKKSGKKLAAVFVGETLASAPAASRLALEPTRRRVQDWKQVLWHWRKRVAPPASPSQHASWQQLQEAARNVR